MIHLLEVDAFDPSVGGVVTLRFSSGQGFTSLPSDTPANEWYEPRILQPGRYDRFMFGSGSTMGAAEVSYGDIELANIDGGLDRMRKLAFDGRALRLFEIADEDGSLARRIPLFSGTLEYAEVTEEIVTLRIRDRLAELAKPLPRTLYLGTTTAGGA